MIVARLKRITRTAGGPSADRAAYQLWRTAPGASAGHTLWPPARLLAGPAVFGAGLCFYAPDTALNVLVIVAAGFIAALSALRLLAAWREPVWTERAAVPASCLPTMTIIVALYDEAAVAPDLISELSRLDYPRDRLEVLLALEACDVATIAAARAATRRAPLDARVLVAPEIGPRTKPRALNYALQAARGGLITVYDAEDAPSPDQLRAAAEAFAADPGLGVVQAPLGWYNQAVCWLTRQFALEYAAQFHALLPAYHRLGLPLPLGGTSNVFRAEALKACGAWDPFNVTEDADLGFRLARHGWRAGLIEPDTREEAPENLRAWIGQRSRWLKGHAVTWLVQMRDPRGLAAAAGKRALAGLQLSLFANAACALVYPPGLLLLLLTATAWVFGATSPAAQGALLAGLAAHGAAYVMIFAGARRAGLRPRLLDLATLPAYWMLQWPAALRALYELGVRPYVWVKTRHGVSHVRREAPDVPVSDPRPDGALRRRVRVCRVARRAPVKSVAAAARAMDLRRHSRRRAVHSTAGPHLLPDGT